jgi:hypothetical protein
MERRLFEWYNDYHFIKKFPVTSKMIKNKALEFSTLSDFNASKGWLEKFKKKYNLQLSRSSLIGKMMKQKNVLILNLTPKLSMNMYYSTK